MDVGMSVAAQAINQGMAHFSQAAERVSAGPGQTGFVSAVIDMKAAEHEVEAAAAVFRAADDIMGQLIDTMA